MPFVPYKVGTDPQFDRCLPDIEAQEGAPWSGGPGPARAFSDDAHDPGGKTMEGITQKEYFQDRLGWGLPVQPVRLMSKDEERTIYYMRYWLPYCPKLYGGLNLEFFNMSVNGGPKRAIENLQSALGLKSDGAWGPKTQAAVAALSVQHPQAVIDRYRAVSDQFYKRLPGFRWFGKDWLRRDAQINAQADTLDKALDAFIADKPASIMKG